MTLRKSVTKVAGVTHADCRLLGHSWDSFSPPTWNGTFRNVLHLRCERCGTTRHDSFNVHGELMQRSYDHPPDYKLSADDKPTRTSFDSGPWVASGGDWDDD